MDREFKGNLLVYSVNVSIMKQFYFLLVLLSFVTANSQNFGLDTTFGNNGKTILSVTLAPIKVFFENNKYIFIYHNGASSVNYDGTLNTAFGNNGYISFNTGSTNENYIVNGSKIINGNIYVYGQKSITSNVNKDGFIIKLSLSGIYDSSFGINGKSIINFGENEETINDLNSNALNQIYIIGTRNSRIFLSKINFNGLVNTDFDPTGYKIYSLNQFESSRGVNLFFQLDKILLVGNSIYPATASNNTKYLIIVKVDENGILSSNFGVNGIKEVVLSSNTSCAFSIRKSFLKDDNELYFELLGSCSYNSLFNKLYKYNFSDNLLSDLNDLPVSNVKFEINTENKIFITGAASCNYDPCGRSYVMNKKNSDGTPDLNFNTTGSYSYRFGPISDDYSSTFYIHDDGKILIAGYTTNNGNFGVPNTPGLGIIRITNTPLNTDNFNENKLFKIYPNPASSLFYIENPLKKDVEKIEIIDLNGRNVNIYENVDGSINVENLESGVYFVKIFYENKFNIQRLIKT